MVSCLRCPNKAKHILITNVIFQSNHEQKKQCYCLSFFFFNFPALNSWMCIWNHENRCPVVWQWLSTMSHFHPRLITTTHYVTVKSSLSIGGILLRAAAIQLTVNKIILKALYTILFYEALSCIWKWSSLGFDRSPSNTRTNPVVEINSA